MNSEDYLTIILLFILILNKHIHYFFSKGQHFLIVFCNCRARLNLVADYAMQGSKSLALMCGVWTIALLGLI